MTGKQVEFSKMQYHACGLEGRIRWTEPSKVDSSAQCAFLRFFTSAELFAILVSSIFAFKQGSEQNNGRGQSQKSDIQQETAMRSRNAGIHGRITDAQGQPLKNVTITGATGRWFIQRCRLEPGCFLVGFYLFQIQEEEKGFRNYNDVICLRKI